MLQQITVLLFIASAITLAVVLTGDKRQLCRQRRRMRLVIRSVVI